MFATLTIALAVVLAILLTLVAILLLVEAKVVPKGERRVNINDDPEHEITAPAGKTLLTALVQNEIYLPSACGGKGSCGYCKCQVLAGSGELLPTELPHLTRAERLDHVRLACQVKVREDLRIRIPDEIFSITKYAATVVSNDNVASFIKELRIKLDPGVHLDFKTGSYVQIDIPPYRRSFRDIDVPKRFSPVWDHFNFWELVAENDEDQYRSYSMANTPEEDDLRFTVRIATPPPGAELPPGIASSYLFMLKSGDKVTFSGPFGEFFIQDTDREMCFIGGGAGMAPLRSHIFHQLLTENTSRKITFWYGARSKIEMFYDEEFRDLEKRFPNFSYHVALSDPQPDDHWGGSTGFIHQVAYDEYLKDHPDPTEVEYYLCGPPMMATAVLKMLDSLGVDPVMIRFDDFGG
ncbi:MAG: NADH:ubiquinone reductase (Na(+)-transporting) subunit F [Desulfuromonadaceae bacterium]|nr:NADH:ubiquinone reductase (Na(+)-transporting) subunit F [Desulfuromonadaceae bacterium]